MPGQGDAMGIMADAASVWPCAVDHVVLVRKQKWKLRQGREYGSFYTRKDFVERGLTASGKHSCQHVRQRKLISNRQHHATGRKLTIRQLDDVDSHLVQSLYIGDLLIRRVDAADELLDASHQLLMRVFDPSVVDPKFVYLDAVTDTSGDIRDYAPQFYAGVFPQGKDEWIAGFVAGDVMRLGAEGPKLQLAIGNIATSPRLREMGFRGVGRTLWQAAVKGAANQAALVNKTLAFSSSEAEPASLPFWSKLGYKWPEGVKYFQPPLEFDEKGIPVHEEVPETLLVYAFDPHASVISVLELKEMIEAMYWNWAVRPSIRRLNSSALQRARAYVMETVLEKTLQTVPKTGNLPLVAVPADKAH